MIFHALPPEVTRSMLEFGAGPGPMLAAAAGWTAHAAALETQAASLAKGLADLGGGWTGSAADTAIAATVPMVAFLQNSAAQATVRAAKATAQAGAYTQTLVTTPTLVEIATNHITTATLTATNFFGINTMPIAANETDYFVRMWNQAAASMDIYKLETVANTLFDQLEPLKAILDPAIANVQNFVGDAMGKFSGMASQVADFATDFVSQAGNYVSQMTLADVAPLVARAAPNMISQLTQPLTQVTSLFSGLGGAAAPDGKLAQIGLLGASPFSNHPLAGGTGALTGSGLLRADALPGLGGTAARTPLMSELISRPLTSVAPASVSPAAVGAGAATAGAGAGAGAAGGAAPMGAMGRGGGGGAEATKAGLVAPAPMAADDDDDFVDWDDQDDW